MGLREFKKVKTRKMISDLATQLFIEKGYSNVTVAEIAKKAEVSVPTLFNYFPTKESLIFDEEKEREEILINAVLLRKSGTSILDSLEQHFLQRHALIVQKQKSFLAFKNLIKSTPELSHYQKEIWMRYEQSLAQAIKKGSEQKIEQIEAETIAHFILDAVHRAAHSTDFKTSLISLFKILKEGWAQ